VELAPRHSAVAFVLPARGRVAEPLVIEDAREHPLVCDNLAIRTST